MSVINKMLKDLDERGAAGARVEGIPRGLNEPLPSAGGSGRKKLSWLLGVPLVLVVAWVAWDPPSAPSGDDAVKKAPAKVAQALPSVPTVERKPVEALQPGPTVATPPPLAEVKAPEPEKAAPAVGTAQPLTQVAGATSPAPAAAKPEQRVVEKPAPAAAPKAEIVTLTRSAKPAGKKAEETQAAAKKVEAKAPRSEKAAPPAATSQPPQPVTSKADAGSQTQAAAKPERAVAEKPAPAVAPKAEIVALTRSAEPAGKKAEEKKAAPKKSEARKVESKKAEPSKPAAKPEKAAIAPVVVAQAKSKPVAPRTQEPAATLSKPSPAATPPAQEAAKARISIERQSGSSVAERADAEYRRAAELMTQGRLDSAIEGYQGVLRRDGRHVPARQALVALLVQRGRKVEAQAVLEEGLRAIPDNTGWAMLLARLQVDAGDAAGASQTLDAALPYAKNRADYHSFAGTVLQMQGRHREALAHYEIAVKLTPSSSRALIGLAISLEEEQRGPEARAAYERALANGGLGQELRTYVEGKVAQLK